MGAGAIHVPDFINHPTRGLVMVDAAEFNRLTQKNEIPLNQVSLPTGVVNQRVNFRIPNRGIATELRLWFALSVTASAGPTARGKWPYGFVKNLRVRANSSDLVNCSGLDLHALRQISSRSGDFSDLESVTLASGAQTYRFCVVVPLATDPETLTGSLFAESDDTHIDVEVTTEAEAELLTGATMSAYSCTIDPVLTTFDVPHVQTSKGSAIVIPPMDTHHMLGSTDINIPSTGVLRAAVSRANGQLLRLGLHTYDATAYAFLSLASVANSVKLQYGQNQVLREHRPARDLLFVNAREYGDILASSYAMIDLVADNAYRDVIVPDAVTDLEAVIDYSGTVTNGDTLRKFEQVIVASPTWAKSTPVDMAA